MTPLQQLLAGVQWSAKYWDGDIPARRCPVCNSDERAGHAESCELQAALLSPQTSEAQELLEWREGERRYPPMCEEVAELSRQITSLQQDIKAAWATNRSIDAERMKFRDEVEDLRNSVELLTYELKGDRP